MKFSVGDKVKVVRYGALVWSIMPLKTLSFVGEKGGMQYYDIHPELVGKEATVDGISKNDYSLYFADGGHMAWFTETQLELA